MPVTFLPPKKVRRTIELHEMGYGVRRIANIIGESKDSVWRVLKNYREGKIEIGKGGTVRFHNNPAGVIRLQAEGLWDPHLRRLIKTNNVGVEKSVTKQNSNEQTEHKEYTALDFILDYWPLPSPLSLRSTLQLLGL